MLPSFSTKVLSLRERSLFSYKTSRDGSRLLPSPLSVAIDDRNEVGLLELNNALDILCEIFPDVRPEVFREMLTTFSHDSRLHVVAEALLQHRDKFVRGRLHLSNPLPSDADNVAAANGSTVKSKESFRSESYKLAVRSALEQEFHGLGRPTIKAVIAENNHSYLESRQTLISISAKSWRYSLVNLFLRRDITSDSPLIDWKDTDRGPVLRKTTSVELNEELEALLVAPVVRERVQQRLRSDRHLAEDLNQAEAEEANSTYDCECCYTPNSFENMTVCSGFGHYICSRCIRHTAKEAVYGQGWARSIDVSKSSLRCIAPTSHGECEGCIPHYAVQRAVEADHDTAGLWQRVEYKLARQACDATNETLSTCPFCQYAEIQVQPAHSWTSMGIPMLRSTMPYSFIGALSCLSVLTCPKDIPWVVWAVFHAFSIALVLLWIESPRYSWLSFTLPTDDSSPRLNQGRKFFCRNPACARVSCLDCSAGWRDVHACYSASRQSLRTYVEAAITDAVKRTCPRCNVSFVKSTGCNKLVCVCGYAMCYVCRGQIGGESYSHFCPHFRPNGGPCVECTRCDLYKAEDEDEVVRQAKERAEQEWWAGEGKELGESKQGEWAQQGVLGDMVRRPRPMRARSWLFG